MSESTKTTLQPNITVDNLENQTLPVTEKRQKPIEYFNRMIDRVEEYFSSNDFTYEGYVQEVLSVFENAPHEVLVSIVKDYFEYDKDLASEAIDIVAAVDNELCYLLVDPGIALRASEFTKFASTKKGFDPIKLRKEFISSFPTQTFFRAVKLEPAETLQPNSHLAPKIRKIIEMPTSEYVKYLKDDLNWVIKNYDSTKQVDHFEIPFFSRFSEKARRHVGNSNTNSEFISVSLFPQVAWYAVADNNQLVSDDWTDGTSVIIYSFEMNSYYAFSRNYFFESISDEAAIIKVGNFKISAGHNDVEYLVPIGLPPDFFAHSQGYKKDNGQMPLPE